jgi:formate hydrogenlyase subunit 3/multisubunit Na+/H+ antiporter MnhD subunit
VSPFSLLLGGLGVIVGTGLVALVSGRASRAASLVAAVGAGVGAVAGLAASVWALAAGARDVVTMGWDVPGGALVVGIDPLSSCFLVPLLALGALGGAYGRAYLAGRGSGPARARAAAAFNLLVGAMAVVLLARHALVFLVGWEAMTLCAYLLITFDHGDAEVRRAGWAYLIASHVALLTLAGLFLTFGAQAGGALDFAAADAAGHASAAPVAVVLVLALVGFGIKAGVVGLHVWLPEAHAAAPSHVSALMSGAMIKLGVYGLVRVVTFVPPVAWFGAVLMALALAGGVLGISLALYQRDLKRVLAYSSVENVGVILCGIGLGVWARAHGHTRLATFGFAAGLLHMWNHAAMKGLLFLCAGSVQHGAGSKDLERLGGLLRRMPVTGVTMVVGAVAIAALPPLNGLTGEWVLYRAFAEVGLRAEPAAGLAGVGAIALLALVGGLAALCFVRVVGVALLGAPRHAGAEHAHEAPAAMTAPLAILAVACAALALAPGEVVSLQAPIVAELAGAAPADVRAVGGVLAPLAACNVGLMAAIALVLAVLARRGRTAGVVDTWGCGYAAPGPRLQYTASSFSEMAAQRLLPRWLRPRPAARPPEGTFPRAAAFASDTADPLTRGTYEPFLARWGDRFARLRFMQQGSLHMYLVYILAAAVLGLAWIGVRRWWLP